MKGTVGKDDGLLIVDGDGKMPAPIYKVEGMFIDGDWVWADIYVFDEDLMDNSMSEQIKRFKGLVRSGVMLGVSCVLVAYWDNTNGQDICKKIHTCKGIDTTMNASVKGARITEILEDEISEKNFSEVEIKKLGTGQAVVKMFSDLTEFSDIPKSSKINGKFTSLKVKEFSIMTDGAIEITDVQEQREYTIATVKERLRYAKLSPRQQFRRLMLDYKQAGKAAGGVDKISEEDLRVLKSLFTTDVLNIVKQIYPDIMKGKQISTLIGSSSISKNARIALRDGMGREVGGRFKRERERERRRRRQMQDRKYIKNG